MLAAYSPDRSRGTRLSGIWKSPRNQLKFVPTPVAHQPQLLAEAERRIRNNPGRYVDHVYGATEVGGTSVLLLSDVPFDTLGYRTDLSHEPLPHLTWNVLHKLPKVVGIGGVLMTGIWWITKRRDEVQQAERAQKLREAEDKSDPSD